MGQSDHDLLVIGGNDVLSLLQGREREVLQAVQVAYEIHARGDSSLPHSTFLRFKDDATNRIIALPAALGGEVNAAGVKWIASFPANNRLGFDRASAVMILNSARTGRPKAVLEGSVISAKRTAASAALAARLLLNGGEPQDVGLIGCGLINFEIARFLLTVLPSIRRLVLFDVDLQKAERFRQKCQDLSASLDVRVASSLQTVLERGRLVSFATTATAPHVTDLSMASPETVILHVSLRDLSPEAILSCDNVVDDIDHVCRAQTSVHLAEQMAGNRDFIRCALADLILGVAPTRRSGRMITIFSPFGLGALDLAVGKLVYDRARREGKGSVIGSFLPDYWLERSLEP